MEPPPPPDRPVTRPKWAYPVLVLGLLCSLLIVWFGTQFYIAKAGGEPETVTMKYTVLLRPLLYAAIPLMFVGTLGAIRPWTRGRWWAFIPVGIALFVWLLVILDGAPSLIARYFAIGASPYNG